MEEKETTYIEPMNRGDFNHFKNAIAGWKYWVTVHTKHGGYTKQELDIYIFDDGHVALSDGGAFISLNPEQVAFLKERLP